MCERTATKIRQHVEEGTLTCGKGTQKQTGVLRRWRVPQQQFEMDKPRMQISARTTQTCWKHEVVRAGKSWHDTTACRNSTLGSPCWKHLFGENIIGWRMSVQIMCANRMCAKSLKYNVASWEHTVHTKTIADKIKLKLDLTSQHARLCRRRIQRVLSSWAVADIAKCWFKLIVCDNIACTIMAQVLFTWHT